MTFREKLTALRKSRGMSQEQLAEELNVSRQSISRWEQGSAMPDAGNLLQLSKIFGVSVDYLLHDDYTSDLDLPKVQEVKKENGDQLLFFLVILEIMWVLIAFMTTVILRSFFFSLITMLPMVGIVLGFEMGYRRSRAWGIPGRMTKAFRKKFYKITAWLGTYFPVRLGMMCLFPGDGLIFEIVTVTLWLCTATWLSLTMERIDMEPL